MIQQVLNRQFLQDIAEAVRQEVQKSPDYRRGGKETPLDALTQADLQSLANDLSNAET